MIHNETQKEERNIIPHVSLTLKRMNWRHLSPLLSRPPEWPVVAHFWAASLPSRRPSMLHSASLSLLLVYQSMVVMVTGHSHDPEGESIIRATVTSWVGIIIWFGIELKDDCVESRSILWVDFDWSRREERTGRRGEKRMWIPLLCVVYQTEMCLFFVFGFIFSKCFSQQQHCDS